ncbi:MAG: 16S rRNA (guanine(966)-N(2))-methyltransferase RsmD [Usitatibacter sp.]
MTASGRNRVRIIGGKWRSRLVSFAPAAQLRPTPDRVRETLFNWLGQRLDGLACLDLFAGSGALGFEASSRGARRVVMVENSGDALKALHESARVLGAEGVEVVASDALGYLGRVREKFDVVFVDPPFAGDLAMRAMALLPGALDEGARVYVESGAALALPPSWRAVREDRAGAVRYALYELTP